MSRKIQMVNLLSDTIEKGLLNEETIGYFSYEYLASVLDITRQLKNGQEVYLKIKKYLENISIQRLRAQLQRKEKIIVGFIANYASTWIGDELYRLLEQSEEFEPYVFLMANHVLGQSRKEVKEEYMDHLRYFRTRNIRVIETLDPVSGMLFSWDQIGIKPQLCIWLTPWYGLFRGEFDLLSYSLDTVHTYIPYSFSISENEKRSYSYDSYNQKLRNMTWKNFEESRPAVEMAEKYSFLEGENAVYTGYPKMDVFYVENIDEDDMWDALIKKAGNPKAKRIIYAPHHTVSENEPIHFSTFAFNYMFMLELAQKYQDKTVWIFKPHPQLKYKAVQEGIFANMEAWNEYEQRWKNLRNTEVAKEGLYHILFKKSDAMILDCVSFMAEYLYVHRPLLRLRRDEQYFNDFGKQLAKVHYSAEGTDKDAIEKFLLDVVLAGNDERKEERERFFADNLDYVKENGKNASVHIFEQLKKIKGNE